MAGRWSDEYGWRERDRRPRDDDRMYGRWDGREDRSWEDQRVFGERESGAAYNREPAGYGDWQDRDYAGVSPAMRGSGYGRGQGYGGSPVHGEGGRYYGDDARQPIYRGEYGYGDRGGRAPGYRYDEGARFGSREADRRWAREMRRPASGGTGGYDYERGYGDGGREEDGFEDYAREAGQFFRRAGQRVSDWFSGDDERSHRGRGPKGYQRSDERISDEVHQRLTEDSWLDATHVTVSVSKGEVTLSGTVEDRESKHRAERLIEDTIGVKHVQNNLRVDAGSFFTRPTRGYGDSAQEAALANTEQVRAVTDGDDPSSARKRN